MKRNKKLTQRQQQNAQKLFTLFSEDLSEKTGGKRKRKRKLHLSLKKFLNNAIDQTTIVTTKVEPMFSLKDYFAAKAQKRLEKLTQREEDRQAKADKIAVRAKLKEAKKAAREEKEAKRAARLAKKQELNTK